MITGRAWGRVDMVRRMRLNRKFGASFKRWQRLHPNFMTPNLVRFEKIGEWIVELSRGTGFEDEPLFGVTVLKKLPTRGYVSMGGEVFTTREMADLYLRDSVNKIVRSGSWSKGKG